MYQIESVDGPGRALYIVRDVAGNALTRGRFHSRIDAQRWIDAREARSSEGRASVHTADATPFVGRDVYSDNERLIREVTGANRCRS